MAGIIRQYRPAYFSGFVEEVETFSTIKELLDIEWVNSFKLLGGQINPKFYRYSINRYPYGNKCSVGYENILMAEFNNGYEWWVVGYIDENSIIKELPVFEIKHEIYEHHYIRERIIDAVRYLETDKQILKRNTKGIKALNKTLIDKRILKFRKP